MRVIGTFITILLVVVVGAFLILTFVGIPKNYQEYFKQRIVAEARTGGVPLSIGQFHLGLGEIRAESIEGFYPKTFTSFNARKISWSPFWNKLLERRVAGKLTVLAYDGDISGELSLSKEAAEVLSPLTIKNLSLAMHPQLKALGIDNGRLSATINSCKAEAKGAVACRGDLTLTNLSFPRGFPLSSFGVPASIPPFTAELLSASLAVNEETFSISDAQLRSSLGDAQGNVIFLKDKLKKRITDVDGSFRVSLSASIHAQVGPLLEMFTQGKLTAADQTFTVHIKGKTRAPEVKFSR